jgi:hypothetical protein
LNGLPIEAMVLVKALVLGGDDSVLEIGRNLAERDECIAFAIRSVVNPGLYAALDVHCGCRWVDPPGGQKKQCGKHPKKHYAEAKPSKETEITLPKQGLGARLWPLSHISE